MNLQWIFWGKPVREFWVFKRLSEIFGKFDVDLGQVFSWLLNIFESFVLQSEQWAWVRFIWRMMLPFSHIEINVFGYFNSIPIFWSFETIGSQDLHIAELSYKCKAKFNDKWSSKGIPNNLFSVSADIHTIFGQIF